MDRRKFITKAAAASGLLILKSKTVFGYQANSAVRLGLLGCGNRGTSVATSFANNTGARIVALADIFPDQLAKGKTHFDAVNGKLGHGAIDPKLMFRGHTAYQQLAASSEVDAVQISTPPWFHVEHLDGVVSAGKHAYCEKPVGVDIAQTERALAIAKRVDGKVSMDVGFQIRSAPPFVEIVRRIHAGQIGKIAAISAHYNAPASSYPDRTGMAADELRLRDWLWDRTLSGDILLEQNIHVIDVCNWIMGAPPIKAVAKSSRMAVKHFGNTSDNYEVIFTYPGEVELSFSSTQFGHNGYFDVAERVFGDAGIAEAPYSGPLRILGADPWTWDGSEAQDNAPGKFAADGAFTNNLALADPMKDRSFIESITSGKFHNQIAAGVESARSCMLGRQAAVLGRELTWSEMMKHPEKYSLNMDVTKFN
ncbi:Gfo/Idh/MocA family oxidoreductase [Granulicella sp. dw_53]|uniref:Gfo/Idh/MocA family protein n=1 Tax=Granulicella sp. dw_53 TaxID=2719792 RepID=UPI001BD1C042|nr:Gfo/Idh/MocA family oxidoreductase [Granulicella sp. dw_53]